MEKLGTVSYGIAAAAFVVFSILLLISWRGRVRAKLLLAAAVCTSVWALLLASDGVSHAIPIRYLILADVFRSSVWLLFLLHVLRGAQVRFLSPTIVLALQFGLAVFFGYVWLLSSLQGGVFLHTDADPVTGFGLLLLAFGGLFLVEQLYRNTHPVHRWGVKFLCLGIGLMFAYDLYLYSVVMLYKQVDPTVWFARGAVFAFSVPLLVVAARRNADWSLEIFVSRQAVVYTASLLAVGVYLLAMAFGGYYVRLYGGTWGVAAQIVFLFGGGLLLLMLLFSGSLRAKLRVFVGKHFYRNKYDYREVWLRFAKALSTPDEESSVYDRSIVAVAETVESRAGALWIAGQGEDFTVVGSWNLPVQPESILKRNDTLVSFLERREWIVDTQELKERPELYDDLKLPSWIDGLTKGECLILPLYTGESLAAVMILARPIQFTLTWEDTDLLRTVGQQVASHLAEYKAQQRLAESRQFDAYNRLASFIMHDLKNLIAQQLLVVNNAAKHKDNPEFIDDMISTVDNSVKRMSYLLTQLRPEQFAGNRAAVDVADVVSNAVAKVASDRPEPQLNISDHKAYVKADPSKLTMVVRHIIKNAQDATPDDGTVVVSVFRKNDQVGISVKDTGVGMDVSFQQQQLFRPFFSTKGSKGMGIGAYQAREFAREAGGDVEVESSLGVGTTFTMWLPAAQPKQVDSGLENTG